MRIPSGLLTKFALAALIAFAPALAEAKMGGSGGGMGSRGSRTFSAPPSTRTAPSPTAPIERSITPQGSPSAPLGGPAFNSGAQRPFGTPGAATGGFGRGLLGGLAGGLLGAGLFGMLTGQGFLGGMGGFMSIIGLLIQIAVIVFLARLAFNWYMNRGAATAGAGMRSNRGPFAGFGFGGMGGGTGTGAGAARPAGSPPPRATPIKLANEDFPAFERLLGQSQEAYSREDVAGLHRVATPEMVSYFEEELNANRAKGVVNRISGVKLLQGDLAEAWREGSDEYATVAMRFALCDVTEDRASGRIVSGDPAQPTQSTEVWTFRRPAGAEPDAWKLSAIQHTA